MSGRLPSKGRLFWRREFYSIHSFSNDRCPECPTEKHGRWRNVWLGKVEHFIYRHNYRLWHWWVNRPNSKARRRLEAMFPNLKAQ